MKRKIVRLFSLIFVFTFFTSVLPTANATSMRASDYFAYTDTCATPLGNGTVAFEFDINATHTMQKLGAETIYIWEEQSNGNFEVVKTYSGGMLSTNTAAAYGRIDYRGTSGTDYYDTMVLYAKDSNGSEKLYSDTYVVTA